jgi:exosome complex RNA-binding protein Rrp42 (RNase PH superfamily)
MSSRQGIVSRLKQKKIHEVIASGKRMDGRGLEEYRDVVVKTGVMEKAHGSAEVYLGKSRVLVGVSVQVGRPFEDTPDRGVLMCNAEFTPVAHPTFEPGPPRAPSIELAREKRLHGLRRPVGAQLRRKPDRRRSTGGRSGSEDRQEARP